MNNVAPLQAVQGPSAPSFAQLVRAAMYDAEGWRQLTKRPDDAGRAKDILLEWKRDLRSQRRIRTSRVELGESSRDEFNQWLIRSGRFERTIDQRLIGLNRPNPESRTQAKRRNGNLQAALHQLGVAAMRSEHLSESLTHALDNVMIDCGSLGTYSLRDALTAGYLLPSNRRES